MKMLIGQFAVFTGVSVRTLHYYDEIGLLRPALIDEENGYRYYDEGCAERMRDILYYRELGFTLKGISQLLAYEKYDRRIAIREQKKLLMLKKKRLERLIIALEEAEKGEIIMNKDAFDNSEFTAARDSYAEEARRRWQGTKAYEQCEEKTSAYAPEDWKKVDAGMDRLIERFALLAKEGKKPDDDEVQSAVEDWRRFITENYYDCTKQILSGLGEMYTADERFTGFIDSRGAGTARLMSEAIRIYCAQLDES